MLTKSHGTTTRAEIIAACNGETYHATLAKQDALIMQRIVNQGIDSHLEAVTDSKFYYVSHPTRLVCEIAPADLAVIVRRMYEDDSDEALDLRSSILYSLDIEEI